MDPLLATVCLALSRSSSGMRHDRALHFSDPLPSFLQRVLESVQKRPRSRTNAPECGLDLDRGWTTISTWR